DAFPHAFTLRSEVRLVVGHHEQEELTPELEASPVECPAWQARVTRDPLNERLINRRVVVRLTQHGQSLTAHLRHFAITVAAPLIKRVLQESLSVRSHDVLNHIDHDALPVTSSPVEYGEDVL